MLVRFPRRIAALALTSAVAFFFFHAALAEPQYETAMPVTVNAGGVYMDIPAGSSVVPMGPPSGGNVMIRVTLPNGSVTMAQVPASSIREKISVPAATPPPVAATAPAPAPAAAAAPTPTPFTPMSTAATPATHTANAPVASTGGNDAQSKYNVEGSSNGEAVHSNWKLIWEDDFSKDNGKLDQSKWAYKVDGKGNGNGEQQYYSDSPKNVKIENGQLVITAIQEKQGWASYTSGKIWTQGKFDVLYGRIEACIKVPPPQMGNWPAFWMMPTDSAYGGWPNSGEIDIMECINNEDTLYGTNHFGTGKKQSGAKIAAPGGNLSNDYHVYAVEWEPKEFRWYLDGKMYGKINEWGTGKAPFPAPFDKKFYIILNYALGGAWPSGVAHHKTPDQTSKFPQSMYVKYVRVYQPQ